MAIQSVAENPLVPPSLAKRSAELSEIVHDLKNCMSILLYWVEVLETDTSSSVRSEDSIDDVKKIARKMNCLVERLDAL
jgi:hypothetical protein